MAGITQGTHGTHDAGTGPRDRIVFALILIAVGAAGLFVQLIQPTMDIGGWIVLLIGVGLLGAFVFTRGYGYLVPAGILTGLGVGIVVSGAIALTDDQTGGVVVLGLGTGFLSIWVIGSLLSVSESHWWPLVPGGILAVVGGALLIGGQAVDLLDYWGVAIIALGLLVLARAWMETRARGER